MVDDQIDEFGEEFGSTKINIRSSILVLSILGKAKSQLDNQLDEPNPHLFQPLLKLSYGCYASAPI
jgi:hypothetical protein